MFLITHSQTFLQANVDKVSQREFAFPGLTWWCGICCAREGQEDTTRHSTAPTSGARWGDGQVELGAPSPGHVQDWCLSLCSEGQTQILLIDWSFSHFVKFSTSFTDRLLWLYAGFHKTGWEHFTAAGCFIAAFCILPRQHSSVLVPSVDYCQFSLVGRDLLSSWKAGSKDHDW